MNFIANQGKRIDKIYEKLIDSNSLFEETRRHLKPVGTRLGIMYGSGKVHKKGFDGCSPFRPYLSVLQTPTYKLSKLLASILESLTAYKNTAKDLFNFATEIVEQVSTVPLWVA